MRSEKEQGSEKGGSSVRAVVPELRLQEVKEKVDSEEIEADFFFFN